MEIKDFSNKPRRAQWPDLRQRIAPIANGHAGLHSLHSHEVFAPQGVIITFSRKGKDVLSGSVGFIEYHEGMHLDALDIFRDYLKASKKEVKWDTVSFFKRAQTLRDIDLPIVQLETSSIARYANLGFSGSLEMIKKLQDQARMLDEIYKSVLGNTACIKITKPDSPKAEI